MIKLSFCLRRLPHLSRAEFQRYWWGTHASLVRENAAALGIRRYVQTHTIDHPVNQAIRETRGGPEEFDGIAELWWDSVEALFAAMTTAEGQRASMELLDDEKRFIDLSRSVCSIAEEKPVIG